jgi:thiamin-phosphate kinase
VGDLVRVLTAAESARADGDAIAAGTPSRALMQRAGAAAASVIAQRCADALAGGVAVHAGPGNNGGDAYVVAAALARTGARVALRAWGGDEPRTEDARYERARALAGRPLEAPTGGERLVVDGVLGTGTSGAPRGWAADAVRAVRSAREQGAIVVALDVPTGLDATTGAAPGDVVQADLTIAFGSAKRGLLVARDLAGAVVVVDIGLPAAPDATPRLVRASAPRPFEAGAHKGTRGKVAVYGGAEGMAGAALLAGRAALRSGAGLVKLLVARESLPAAQVALPAALATAWPEDDGALDRQLTRWAQVLLLGPGLGGEARDRCERALRAWRGPVVVDADALNAFAGELDALASLLGGRPALVTPHPLELARLLGAGVDEVLERRFDLPREAAARLGASVLLKGVPTVVADADRTLIVATGAPALATGGSGDVLGGIVATLLAHAPVDAVARTAAEAAWVHDRAGALAAGRRGGARGVDARRRARRAGRCVAARGRRADPVSGDRRAAGGAPMTIAPQTHRALGAGREFDVVRALLARWGDAASGVGDDAAVLDVPAGERLVVSTDASIEGAHFRRGWLTPEEIGWRAATSALSDLAAMAARPIGLVLALALPDGWRDAVDGLADGVGAAARAAGAPIVGGDLVRSRELGLTITVFGAARRPIGRDGARPEDALYVTGALGGPQLAVAALERGQQPEPGARARFARPAARIAEAGWLAERGASALVDVSDGLAADVGHLAAASGVRIVLEAATVPRLAGAGIADALGGGEEYELALAAPPGLDTRSFRERFGVLLTPIGRVERAPGGIGEVEIVDGKGRRVEIPPGTTTFRTDAHPRRRPDPAGPHRVLRHDRARGPHARRAGRRGDDLREGAPVVGARHAVHVGDRRRDPRRRADAHRRAPHLRQQPRELVRRARAGRLPAALLVRRQGGDLPRAAVRQCRPRGGTIPIERENRKAAFQSYEEAAERMRGGRNVVVFPEGTRGSSYALRPFKKGPFVLAVASAAPIVPTLIHGTLEALPRGSLWLTAGRVDVHLLEPVPTAGCSYDDRDALAREVYERMAAEQLRLYGIESPPSLPTSAERVPPGEAQAAVAIGSRSAPAA